MAAPAVERRKRKAKPARRPRVNYGHRAALLIWWSTTVGTLERIAGIVTDLTNAVGRKHPDLHPMFAWSDLQTLLCHLNAAVGQMGACMPIIHPSSVTDPIAPFIGE